MSPAAHRAEQLNDLPKPNFYFTGHNHSTGKAIVQEKRSGQWQAYDDDLMAFNVAYTTSEFPPSLNDDIDIEKHDEVLASNRLGLVNKNGTVCRIVDFAPGFDCMMHRTQSLDYGIVLEGSIELVLDSGETQLCSRGDIVVQRGTMHAWRNASSIEWARMVFVLLDCQSLVLGDKKLGEDLGRGVDGLPPSRNDC
ncbi:hypothetical protein NW762_013239 [Fusarium torreyae]|uniref:Cupin type-2 domain-containing protein n=1 Tax=Fusarium torreyae TaxID=1237075 RepID=A0A9W8VAJ0_9HYPO|nr:hypothetical protein NW762_013239 [Fusarium torreyae]